jgi:hypothetical protein
VAASASEWIRDRTSARPFYGLSVPSRFDRLKAPSVSRGKVEGLALAATQQTMGVCSGNSCPFPHAESHDRQ